MDGYVYLATDGEIYKIGRTGNLRRRIHSLRKEAKLARRNSNINFIHSFPCVDSRFCEKHLHTMFAEQCKFGEWFDLCDEQVNFIKAFTVGDATNFPIPDSDSDEEGDAVNDATVKIPYALKSRLAQVTPRGKKLTIDTAVARIIADYLRRYETDRPRRDSMPVPDIPIQSRWLTWDSVIERWSDDWVCVVGSHYNWAICQIRFGSPFFIHKRDFTDEAKYKFYDPQWYLREEFIVRRPESCTRVEPSGKTFEQFLTELSAEELCELLEKYRDAPDSNFTTAISCSQIESEIEKRIAEE